MRDWKMLPAGSADRGRGQEPGNAGGARKAGKGEERVVLGDPVKGPALLMPWF